jgi:hypothetical protein
LKLDAACEPVFNRHETFAPRYGWPKKAYDSCSGQPDLFNSDAGMEQLILDLAVGKNMVKSIRYWARAFRICVEEKQTGNRNKFVYPTAIGETFFSDDGWDPYCEHSDTLWLLHWWLHAPGSLAPVWWLAFNEFTGIEFTANELEQFVSNRTTDWGPKPSAVTRDVTCLIRMYSSGHASRATFDDQLDCPFRELDLIRPSSREPGMFRFNIGYKATLSPAVAAFACLDFVARTRPTAQTTMLSTLSTEPGSPGQVFKLTEAALLDLLRAAATETDGDLKLTSAAGPPQLVVDGTPAQVATGLIRARYKTMVDPERILRADAQLAGIEADCKSPVVSVG